MQIRKHISGKIKKMKGGAQRRSLALQEMLSGYGIGVDEVKAKASQLETVLRELRSREFMNSPSIQRLMTRVKKKKALKTEVKPSVAKKKTPKKSSKLRRVSDKVFNAKLFSDESATQIGTHLVKSILHRVDEIRQSYKKSQIKPTSRKTKKRKTNSSVQTPKL